MLKILLDPLLLPVTIALAAGLAAYVLSRASRTLCRLIALAGSAATLWAALAVVRSTAAAIQWTWTANLVKGLPLPLKVELAHTTLGMLVVVGSAGFALLISIYSFRAMAGTYWEGKFYAYLLWALAGACLVGLAGNLLVLLVGWELVTLMLFLMVNQGSGEAKAGAAKAYGVLGFADACLLLAVALLLASPGGWENLSLSAGRRNIAAVGPFAHAGYVIYLLILVAGLAKAGAVPLHTWIPAIAKDAPTPLMAYLPAALDKLLGIYLVAVLSLRMFEPTPAMGTVMMVVGGVSILAAVLMAMMQHNLKRLLSFHAVSQVGYMVLGLGTGNVVGIIGGLFHMVNNAIYKSSLFMMSGTVRRAAGSDEIEQMGGLARPLPVTFICGAIAAAAISGVPPFNGFASKWLIYQGTLQVTNHGLAVVLVAVAVFGSALTLASFVKAIYSAFLASPPKKATRAQSRPKPSESFFLAAPMVVLAAACIFLGLAPSTMINHVLGPAASAAGQEAAGQTALTASLASLEVGRDGALGLWSPTQATGLIIIGLVLGLIFAWVTAGRAQARVVRPFLAGEVPTAADDRFRVPGTHFYETVAKLPLVGPLLAHGEAGAMDLYHWSGKHGNTLVQMLRAQHTGLLSLYVAWSLVGLMTTLVYLLLTMGT